MRSYGVRFIVSVIALWMDTIRETEDKLDKAPLFVGDVGPFACSVFVWLGQQSCAADKCWVPQGRTIRDLSDSDEMVSIDPSGNTDQGV